MIRSVRIAVVALTAATLAACAVRLGGPSPENYDTVALAPGAGADATQIGTALREAGAEIAFFSTEQDSAWLAQVAQAAQLTLSGPGRTSGRSLAFMTNLELLGDTALMLAVADGGVVHMHDALYTIDEYRNIDLLSVHFDATDLRAAVRTLLGYIATDVGADVALVIAMSGSTPQAADSAAVLMRATLGSALECGDEPDLTIRPPVRLLYGPSARMTCLSVQPFGTPAGVNARLQVR